MTAQANITITGTATDGKFNSADQGGGSPPATFIPMLADDFSSGALGATYSTWHASSVYADDHPDVGGQSVKVVFSPNTQANLDVAACAGGHEYGGRSVLPVDVPIGKTIWMSMKRYFPANLTWGYCYGGGDNVAATLCGQNGDGNAWRKDLVFAPLTGTERIYSLPAVSRRSVEQVPGNRLASEHGAEQLFHDEEDVLYPLGEWFTHQISVYVNSDGTGRIKLWVNGTLVNETPGANISEGNFLHEYGIGDYANGTPYQDGTASMVQWIRELIIATDMDGYGAPTGLDNLGNVFIDPATTVAELS